METMENSFSQIMLEIEEASAENPLLNELLLNGFYNNLPENISKQFKTIFTENYVNMRNNSRWICQHDDCQKPSSYSHEISGKSFLKNICGDDSKVVVLQRDLENNPAFYRGKEMHIRNASNFRGYCNDHDRELFRYIDNGVQKLDDKFLNFQCLRSTRREIFNKQFDIKLLSTLIDSFTEDLRIYEVIAERYEYLCDKRRRKNESLDRLNSIYQKINEGLLTGNFFLEYFEIHPGRQGFYFSSTIDMTVDEDEDAVILYIYHLNFEGAPRAFVAHQKSSFVKNIATQSIDYLLGLVILQKKENIIFSKVLMADLDEPTKDILLRRSEIYEHNRVMALLLLLVIFPHGWDRINKNHFLLKKRARGWFKDFGKVRRALVASRKNL